MTNCPHHWILPPANGPIAPAVCKLCHTTQEFKNSNSDTEAWKNAKLGQRYKKIKEKHEDNTEDKQPGICAGDNQQA